MQTRNEIKFWISEIVGCSADLISTTSVEIDYILSLEGEYQELAVWQAALFVMVQQNRSKESINNLQKLIKQKSELLAEKEVEQVISNELYANQFGFLKPIKPLDLPEPIKWTEDEVNSQWDDYLKVDDFKMQPVLNEALANLKAQSAKKAANEFASKQGEVTLKGIEQQALQQQYSTWKGSMTGGMLGGLAAQGASLAGNTSISVKPDTPKPVSLKPIVTQVEVQEEFKGRKFRDAK